MARYDVFRSPEDDGFLLDIQSNRVDHFQSRVVVPLLPIAQRPSAIPRLHPEFIIDGQNYVMAMQLLSAVPVSILTERVSSFSSHHDEIGAALDMLFLGF